MQRRVVLAGLGATILGPDLARADENSAPLGDAERRYIDRLTTLGAASLATARLARRKGDDDDVKEFVQFEVSEQEVIADVLQSLSAGTPATGRVTPPSDDDVAARLDSAGQEGLRGLGAQKVGLDFDQAFVRLQTELHRHMLDAGNDYLRSGRAPLLLGVAKLARAMTSEHLTVLGDIDAALGRG